MAETPMMEQHRRIKREHPGAILFFRLGDFYEMFGEDAVEVAALLNLTLTSRNGRPMCGVPYLSVRSYIARLLKMGKKVALCEQLTEPGKGLIERKVVEVITPGTTIEEDFLERGTPNYLACFAASGAALSFAYIDLSAGDFYASSFSWDGAAERLRLELERLQPKELIVQESLLLEHDALAQAVRERAGIMVNRWADWLFDRDRSRARLDRQFGQSSLKGFGLKASSPEVIAAGALLDYLDTTARTLLPHVRRITVYRESEFVGIDEATQRNLELTRNLQDGDTRFTLLSTMDETRTAMGRRLLKTRLLHPLRDIDLINQRLDVVDAFYRNQEKLSRLRDLLGRAPDLERLAARVAMDKAHGKDLAAVKTGLATFALIEAETRGMGIVFESAEAASLDDEALARLADLRDVLERGLLDDPAVALNEGNLIRPKYSQELDRQKRLRDSGRQLLEKYLVEEQKATGITSLKIRYNRLIGYFFEVAKNQLAKVPPRFIRRQGMAQGERFTTDRLAALESDINGASDRIIEIEKTLFLEMRDKAKELLAELEAAGHRMAELDAAQSLARSATAHGWVRPELGRDNRLLIRECRHPVVEAQLNRGEFIPNDVILDAGEAGSRHEGPAAAPVAGAGSPVARPVGAAGGRAAAAGGAAGDDGDDTDGADGDDDAAGDDDGRDDDGRDDAAGTGDTDGGAAGPIAFALITGPNMAGKSTYLRQAALTVVMAQTGSFVPAREAYIGVCDRIYCRVGASDNLARGESTFLVEMNETAYILNTATDRSLVIMDEVGRGTGTKDGLAIAWAVSEELLNRVRCRTLFATHYHELARLSHPRMANRSMEVADQGGELVFLRRLREGSASQSYGLHVARLAGLSAKVIERAQEILDELEVQDQALGADLTTAAPRSRPAVETGAGSRLLKALSGLDLNAMTPMDALTLLHDWKLQAERWSTGPRIRRVEMGPSLFDP